MFDEDKSITEDEFVKLLATLRAKESQIGDTYEYPLEDLIEYLENSGANACRALARYRDGEAVVYQVDFCSPKWTWDMLCGVEGCYYIDGISYRALRFEVHRNN